MRKARNPSASAHGATYAISRSQAGARSWCRCPSARSQLDPIRQAIDPVRGGPAAVHLVGLRRTHVSRKFAHGIDRRLDVVAQPVDRVQRGVGLVLQTHHEQIPGVPLVRCAELVTDHVLRLPLATRRAAGQMVTCDVLVIGGGDAILRPCAQARTHGFAARVVRSSEVLGSVVRQRNHLAGHLRLLSAGVVEANDHAAVPRVAGGGIRLLRIAVSRGGDAVTGAPRAGPAARSRPGPAGC